MTGGCHPRPAEVEVALAVASSAPGRLADQIAGLASIEGIALVPIPSQRIHDVQMDTADRALAAGRFSLRVRTIGTEEWITLKGRPQNTSWGAVERFELERPWSPAALQEVAGALCEAGVAAELPSSPVVDRSGGVPPARPARSAQSALAARGLRPVQIRTTERRRRRVSPPNDARHGSLAELAIDAVTYHLGRRAVRMHEVEIESLGTAGAPVVARLADALIDRFAPALRRWRHGKLATGLAADSLLGAGRLEPLLLADGALGAAAFDAIDRLLVQG